MFKYGQNGLKDKKMTFECTEKPLIDLLAFWGYIAYASPEKVAFERELEAFGYNERLLKWLCQSHPFSCLAEG